MKISLVVLIISLFCVPSVRALDQAPQWEQEVEFNGGYVKSLAGTYLEIKETKDTRMDDSNYSITDKESITSILKNEFQGLVLKGMHHLDTVSLHPLVEIISEEKPRKFYALGKEINIRKKSLGSDSYYFQPRTPLQKGEYVLKSMNKFWLFELKAGAVQSLPEGASADEETISFMEENQIRAVSIPEGVGLFFDQGPRRRKPIPCSTPCTFRATEEIGYPLLEVSSPGRETVLYAVDGDLWE